MPSHQCLIQFVYTCVHVAVVIIHAIVCEHSPRICTLLCKGLRYLRHGGVYHVSGFMQTHNAKLASNWSLAAM